MSLDEWAVPDLAEMVAADPAAVDRLVGNGYTVTIEDSGYTSNNGLGIIVRFDDGDAIGILANSGGTKYIQVYGQPVEAEVDKLRSGRTDLGVRQVYIALKRTS